MSRSPAALGWAVQAGRQRDDESVGTRKKVTTCGGLCASIRNGAITLTKIHGLSTASCVSRHALVACLAAGRLTCDKSTQPACSWAPRASWSPGSPRCRRAILSLHDTRVHTIVRGQARRGKMRGQAGRAAAAASGAPAAHHHERLFKSRPVVGLVQGGKYILGEANTRSHSHQEEIRCAAHLPYGDCEHFTFGFFP